MRRLTDSKSLVLLAVMLFILTPHEVLARAGGGGGGGGGGIVSLIVWPILLIYSGIVSYLVFRKSREARAALAKASAVDPFWDPDKIKSRVEYVFFKVQEAWTSRDQSIARDCMSDALFSKHKLQTDLMLKEGTRNVLESINLSGTKIVEIRDSSDNRRDLFWAYITGSMIDYTIRESSGQVIKGKKTKPEKFSELWKFVRAEENWVLDRIDQHVLADLFRFHSTTDDAQGDAAAAAPSAPLQLPGRA